MHIKKKNSSEGAKRGHSKGGPIQKAKGKFKGKSGFADRKNKFQGSKQKDFDRQNKAVGKGKLKNKQRPHFGKSKGRNDANKKRRGK